MAPVRADMLDLLRLTATPDLGPVRIAKLLAFFGSATAALRAAPDDIARVCGVGSAKAHAICAAFADSLALAHEELARCDAEGVALLALNDAAYPELLRQIPAAPPLLYLKGTPHERDRFAVAIVGSRRCTQYGIEQAERFAGVLARAGITIVSGGARGIDTAAHRGALKNGGRTIAVMGCGLSHTYPPENAPLFADIVAGRGMIVSEIPMHVAPDSMNFPARNRIISGMSLGVLVIEAAKQSGALITARLAIDEHNREVFALPGRVDSPASEGSLELLRAGEAHVVVTPDDVIRILESPARKAAAGVPLTLAPTSDAPTTAAPDGEAPGLFDTRPALEIQAKPAAPAPSGDAAKILDHLVEPRTVDELLALTGLSAPALRTQLTLLEVQRRVVRDGTMLKRAR
ncbi:MAG: DNA-processing protein DprA [Planctomycetota bacterium]|nr:DNA-processing protein DprA [Planctomycetota bacterium]